VNAASLSAESCVLATAIRDYRDKHIIAPDSSEDLDLQRLGNDLVIRHWWNNSRRPAYVTPSGILSIIFDCRHCASLNKDAPTFEKAAAKRYSDLQAAAALLAEHYDQVDSFFLTTKQNPFAAAHNDKLIQLRSALLWAQKELADSVGEMHLVFKHTFASGQKRHDTQLAFQKIISRRLMIFFDQPFDTLVAAVSSALYPENEPVTPEAVRKARVRNA
jgi:hypothetical protein